MACRHVLRTSIIAAAVATFLLGLLAGSIFQRRQEAKARNVLKEIAPWESDSSLWAENFPRQYGAYLRMKQTERHTRYGGPFPRDYLEETPENVILFAGYGFSIDYKQARGHIYALQDVKQTRRVNPRTVATCWTCKSSDVPRVLASLGDGDLTVRAAKFYRGKFSDFEAEMKHPIGCLDCHEPNTMRLRITRPALVDGLRQRGLEPEQLSHQQMRSLVCAQCHVEYYFKGAENYLVFPWKHGMTAEKIQQYYEEVEGEGFGDWKHPISGGPMLKMQHPDYELYSAGIHAYRDVACADCHMPYRTEGGMKYTDHHVQSPLLNIANSCTICHRWSEAEILARVESIQDGVQQARRWAEKAIVQAHFDIAAAAQAGASDEELAVARKLVRQAQLRWDYVAAANGMGFHAPQLSLQTLAAAVDIAGRCRVECARILARHGITSPVEYPDFATKEKAQAVVKAFLDKNPPPLIRRP